MYRNPDRTCPYVQDPQDILENTELEANNSNTVQSYTCDNRDMFQELYVWSTYVGERGGLYWGGIFTLGLEIWLWTFQTKGNVKGLKIDMKLR